MANVKVNFLANTANFKKGVATVKAGIRGVSGLAMKALAPLAAMAGIAGTIGTAFKGISLASDFEDATVQISAMIGSTRRAEAMLKKLNTISNNTPFVLQDLVDTAKLLGVESEKLGGDKGMMEWTKRLTDVAAIVGKDKLPQLSQAFANALNMGQVEKDMAKSFALAGTPMMRMLQDQFGGEEGLNKAFRDGKVRAEHLMVALRKMTDQGGIFFKGAERGAETFSGKLSTVLGKFQELLRLGVTPFMEPLKDVLDMLIAKFDEWQPKVQEFAKSVKELARGVISLFKHGEMGRAANLMILSIARDFLLLFATGVQAIIWSIDKWISIWVDQFIRAFETLFAAGKFIIKLGKVLGLAIASGIEQALVKHPLLAAAMTGGIFGGKDNEDMDQAIAELQVASGELGNAFHKQLAGAVGSVADSFKEMQRNWEFLKPDDILEATKESWNLVKSITRDLGRADIGADIVKKLKKGTEEVGGKLKEHFKNPLAFWSDVGRGLVKGTAAVVDKVKGLGGKEKSSLGKYTVEVGEMRSLFQTDMTRIGGAEALTARSPIYYVNKTLLTVQEKALSELKNINEAVQDGGKTLTVFV